MTTTTGTTPDPFADVDRPRDKIPRDRFKRPLVLAPDGSGRRIPYTRCTTFVGCLEDTFNLAKWQQRQVAIGLAKRPDLVLSAAAHADDKDALNALVEEAHAAAGSTAAATTGTALHKLTDLVDTGALRLDEVPASARAHVETYLEATARFRPVLVERLTVLDDLKIAGTPDRVVESGGIRRIGDLKTGSLDYGMAKIAMQLAVYAHSALYDHDTGDRLPLHVDLDVAYVFHLPAVVEPGQRPTCTVVPVDIGKGWKAVRLAAEVRAHRADKAWTCDDPERSIAGDLLSSLIAAARSADEVRALWPVHHALFTPAHLDLASARIAALEATP